MTTLAPVHRVSSIFVYLLLLQLEKEISEGTSEFSGLRQEIAKLQSKENTAKTERLEANNAVNKMEKSIQDCTTKTPMWEKEVICFFFFCILCYIYCINCC